jgi:UTP-glucose-1-phosphate uridylyltransferase
MLLRIFINENQDLLSGKLFQFLREATIGKRPEIELDSSSLKTLNRHSVKINKVRGMQREQKPSIFET